MGERETEREGEGKKRGRSRKRGRKKGRAEKIITTATTAVGIHLQIMERHGRIKGRREERKGYEGGKLGKRERNEGGKKGTYTEGNLAAPRTWRVITVDPEIGSGRRRATLNL